ncbi:MAG TPA: 30S ribosomal protein S18 [Tenericutes bacterium]|jgi:small subunit ribosomal protein S18|nr:30S ribosomal protein S18 [Mycoplasmatota bacterium]
MNPEQLKKGKAKKCYYCEKDAVADYKDVDSLKRYLSERGKILPRRLTGLCAKHQREVTRCIKRARIMSLLPFVND